MTSALADWSLAAWFILPCAAACTGCTARTERSTLSTPCFVRWWRCRGRAARPRAKHTQKCCLCMSWPAGLAATSATPVEPLRLAVCRVYTPLPPDDGMLISDLSRLVDERTFFLDQLGVMLVMAVPQVHVWH